MQSESKYLERFKRLQDASDLYRLHGGRLLVEILPQQEIKSSGGIVLAAPKDFARGSTAESSRGTIAVVLLVGAGYIGADGVEYAIDAKPGSIILLNDFGLRCFSTLPGISDYVANSVALIDESHIQMSWESMEKFNKYVELLK
jgi:co-chaperonin GroES (HSP10)